MQDFTKFIRISIFLVLSLSFLDVTAQDLKVRGQIKGLTTNEKKSVPVVLDKARVEVMLENKVVPAKTNMAGVYIVELKKDKRYLMTVSRDGYNSKSIWINTHNLPKTKDGSMVELTDLDFILLKTRFFPDDISPMEDMGQISYDPKKKKFHTEINRDFRKGKDAKDNSIRLLNKTLTYVDEVEQKKKKSQSGSATPTEEDIFTDVDTSSASIEEQEEKLNLIFNEEASEIGSLEEIEKRKEALAAARVDLEELRQNAKTREDSLLVERLEAQLKAAERDLLLAERTILFQQNEISAQKRLVTISIVFSLSLLLVLSVIAWLFRDKIKLNKSLAEKNKVIMDGINYANTIQNSFLKSEAEIQALIPDSVLFFKPRDVVSGDIYWANKVSNKVILASIDCTGHGVPGAFISMIANTLLNEIVNNKKILDPGKILNELHKGVIDALQQEAGGNQAQDGMDMSLVAIDQSTRSIEFAGAKNHIYVVNGSDLQVIKADINSIGGRSMRTKDGFNKVFNTKSVPYEKGGMCYLFSDGYMDQFGGPDDEKFNLQNFRDLLVKCASQDQKAQKSLLDQTFAEWIGEHEQLDDVLVLGIRLS